MPPMKKPVPESKEEVSPVHKYRKKLGRLPDKTSFQAWYDAKILKWKGSLVIGSVSPALIFEAEESGIFTLLQTLDGKWRTWLKQHNGG